MIRLFKFAILLLMLMIPVHSFAWEQTYTCDTDLCGEGDQKYPRQRISWPSPNVTFYLNHEGTYQVSLYDTVDAIQKSIDTWIRPDVSSLRANYAGFTTQSAIGYDRFSNDNQNIILFRDEKWSESRTVFAYTHVTRNNVNGNILDADIELNSTYNRFGIYEKDGGNVVDLQNTLTHELGHAFGLNHSLVEGATMTPYSQPGDIRLRELGDDELEAIATIYPIKSDDACSARPLNHQTLGSVFWIGLAFCAIAGISRRRLQ